MAVLPEYRRYRDDAAVLVEIGQHLASVVPFVDVTLPAKMVDAAIAAWNRDEDGPAIEESDEQRHLRGYAADLALLGLVLSERGRCVGDQVTVRLPVAHFAAAIVAVANGAG